MNEVLIELMNTYGYFAIALLIFIENVFPPIPSEVVLLFGGFMTTYSDMEVWVVIVTATVGSYAGACVLYAVGRFFNQERLSRIVSGKLGKILHLNREDIRKADEWFLKKGSKTVFFCRCVPIVRSLISIPAGMAQMPFTTFTILTLSGTLIWNTVLVLLGSFSGSAWESSLQYFGWYSKIVLILLALLVIVGGIIYLMRKKRKEKK